MPSSPLLPLSIFRLPTIVGANVVGFMLGAAIFSMFFLLALYMQQPPGLGYSAIRSGVGYLLVACTIIVSAGASQALVGRFGVRRVLILGLVLLTAGLLFFTQVSPHGTYLADLAPGFVLAGIGLGFAFIPVTIAALMGITDDEAGLASGLINTSQQIGGAVGVALLATVFTSRTAELRRERDGGRHCVHRRALPRVPGRRGHGRDRARCGGRADPRTSRRDRGRGHAPPPRRPVPGA